jgi:hypothetical protein
MICHDVVTKWAPTRRGIAVERMVSPIQDLFVIGDSLYYYKLKTAGEAQGVYKGGHGRSKT